MSSKCKWISFVGLLVAYPFFILVVAGFWQAAIGNNKDIRPCNGTKCCLDHFKDYAASLYYTMSVSTTLGFGRLYPCSPLSKVGTFFLLLVGLPYTAFEVVGLTFVFYRLVVWFVVKNCEKPRSRSPDAEDGGPEKDILFAEPNLKYADSTSSAAGGMAESCAQFKKIELIGLVFFFIIFLLIAIYFAAAEKAGLGDAFFFAFLAVFTGDYRLNNFKPAVLLFALTLLAIVGLFLTIGLYFRQLISSVQKIQQLLSREAKAAVDISRRIGLDKFDEIYEMAVDQNTPCFTRRVVMPIFRDYFRQEFAGRLRSNEEVANLHSHYHSLLSQSAEAHRPGINVEDSTSMTGMKLKITLDRGANTDPPKPKHSHPIETQTVEKATSDTESEARPLVQDFISHFAPTLEERGDLAVSEMEDTSLQTDYLGKNVSLQYPEPRPPTATPTPGVARGSAQGRGSRGASPSAGGVKRGGTRGRR